ncbi:MAG: TFIIB-type zinc ribbon-containing protein [Planctomycetota bacterium]|jgi:predicted RNA-binding Zn-ribbon protein involved in translation (DUF1610 family)
MIRFYCEHCAHKISVEDKHAGKQGKCPKCGSVMVVPAESTIIEFHCENCDRKISVPKSYAGKKAICPECNNTFIIPATQSRGSAGNQIHSGDPIAGSTDSARDLTLLDVPEEYKLKDEPAVQSNVFEEAVDRQQESDEDSEAEETESAGQRKLPWFIDIFLYPISIPGLLTMGVIVLGQFLAGFIQLCCCLGLILQIIIVLYMYWYFCECIRDSALGGLRAPETVGSMPGLGEMLWQCLRLLACFAFLFAPMIFYLSWVSISNTKTDVVISLSLLALGSLFFPMGILAVVMFDSIHGVNPVLIIRSIASTFFQYCGLVLFLYALSILYTLILSVGPQWSITTYIFSNIIFIWMLLVAGHLLGRFYWRYENKLYWEV